MSTFEGEPDVRDIVPEIAQETEAARRKVLRSIEETTKRNAVNYSATFLGAPGEVMFTADIVNLTRVLSKNEGRKGVDLILNSPGGQPEVAEKIITTLRHFYDDDFRIIVPEFAKSAGTIRIRRKQQRRRSPRRISSFHTAAPSTIGMPVKN